MHLSASWIPDLLRQARAGDSEACGQLLQTARPYLTLLARAQIGARLQGKVEPADVVQETFIEALRDLASFRGATAAAFLAWLRQILAHNLANLIRHYTTQARDLQLEEQLSVALEQSSSGLEAALGAPQSTPSEHCARAELTIQVANALALLPDDYREALVLRHLEELSFPQIAQRMGRSVNSVEKLWVRGLARLRELLEEDGS